MTAEGKHTPGPWEVEYVEVHGKRYGLRGVKLGGDDPEYPEIDRLHGCTKGGWFTNTVCTFPGVDADEANARLISSAPDMLEALRSINKVASPNPERTFDDVIRDLNYIMDRARAAIAKGEQR